MNVSNFLEKEVAALCEDGWTEPNRRTRFGKTLDFVDCLCFQLLVARGELEYGGWNGWASFLSVLIHSVTVTMDQFHRVWCATYRQRMDSRRQWATARSPAEPHSGRRWRPFQSRFNGRGNSGHNTTRSAILSLAPRPWAPSEASFTFLLSSPVRFMNDTAPTVAGPRRFECPRPPTPRPLSLKRRGRSFHWIGGCQPRPQHGQISATVGDSDVTPFTQTVVDRPVVVVWRWITTPTPPPPPTSFHRVISFYKFIYWSRPPLPPPPYVIDHQWSPLPGPFHCPFNCARLGMGNAAGVRFRNSPRLATRCPWNTSHFRNETAMKHRNGSPLFTVKHLAQHSSSNGLIAKWSRTKWKIIVFTTEFYDFQRIRKKKDVRNSDLFKLALWRVE